MESFTVMIPYFVVAFGGCYSKSKGCFPVVFTAEFTFKKTCVKIYYNDFRNMWGLAKGLVLNHVELYRRKMPRMQ